MNVALTEGGTRTHVTGRLRRRWNRGELPGLPPFFPEDRSRMNERREHELARFAHLF